MNGRSLGIFVVDTRGTELQNGSYKYRVQVQSREYLPCRDCQFPGCPSSVTIPVTLRNFSLIAGLPFPIPEIQPHSIYSSIRKMTGMDPTNLVASSWLSEWSDCRCKHNTLLLYSLLTVNSYCRAVACETR